MESIFTRAGQPQAASRQFVPTTLRERILAVDALRGLALLGVLIENMALYAGFSYDPQVGTPVTLRTVVGGAVLFVLEAKSYSILALLLGWGMAVQSRRAESRGVSWVLFHLRRSGMLLLFGLAHGILIWFGDILMLYALLSVFLVLLYDGLRRFVPKHVDRVLLILSICALFLPILLAMPGQAMDAIHAGYENLTAALRSDRYPESLYSTGTYGQVLGRRVQDLVESWSWLFYYVGNVMSMILLGFYLGQRQVLIRAERSTSDLHKMTWIGLGLGIPFNAIYVATNLGLESVLGPFHGLVRIGSRTLGAPAMVLGFLAGLVLLLRNEAWQRRLAKVALIGRTSLSNYLVQSIACTLLFYGYGLGLYGQVGPLFGLVLALLLYGLQLQISEWWLARYAMGPVEWMWRRLSYGWRTLKPERERKSVLGKRKGHWRLGVGLAVGTLLVATVMGGMIGIRAGWLSQTLSGAANETRSTGPSSGYLTETDSGSTSLAASREGPVSPLLATPQTRPVAYQPGPIAASGDLVALSAKLDVDSILARIGTLTGPPYGGRYPVSPGGRATGDYIAEQFAAYGLQPAGDAGTFFQYFPVEYVALSSVPRLVVERADGTTIDGYVLYQDYAALLRWYSGAGRAAGQVVWANNCERQDFDLDTEEKIVLCRDRSIPEAQRNALEHGASGLLLLTDPERYPPDFGSRHGEAWVAEPIPTFRVYPQVVSDLLLGSGRSVRSLSMTFDSLKLDSRVSMQVETIGAEACPSEGCLARNVLGVLPGRDPDLAREVVVVGAHYDHLGESPDGTVWAGANDNASGVAVLLEIAQRWYEQGYVPRRTVVFAAWDAEEMGLLGSRYYVEHPRYPLQDTVAKLQLDMVGDGELPLRVDGRGELSDRLMAIAAGLGIEAERTSEGRSDHVPFQQAGIPASLLIWSDEAPSDELGPSYHRPLDVASAIDPEKVAAASQVASLGLLALTEGEPALEDLIERRGLSASTAELDAFLATSSPEQRVLDLGWFAALQAVEPISVEMDLIDVRVLGRTATATVKTEVEWTDAQGQASRSSSALPVRFVHDGQRWLWAGPNLMPVPVSESEPGIGARLSLLAPSDSVSSLLGTDQILAQRYTQIAGLLGLSSEIEATLMLFPHESTLWASVSPVERDSVQDEQNWVSFRVAKIPYRPNLVPQDELDQVLVQLAIAEVGVTQELAPWLWRGLPLAVRAELDGVPPAYLAQLEESLSERQAEAGLDSIAWNDGTSWAAVEYLRQEIGWLPLGQFMQHLGTACQDGSEYGIPLEQCSNLDALDQAMATAGYPGAAVFEAVWRAHWDNRLRELRAGLDAILTARTAAVLAGDKAAFLATVDKEIPQLLAEQKAWFADLLEHPVEQLALEGELVAEYKDGFVANVELRYQSAAGARSGPVRLPLWVWFSPGPAGYLWAGTPFEEVNGSTVQLLYPGPLSEQAESYRALAVEWLPETEAMLDRMADALDLALSEMLTIKIYERAQEMQASVRLSRHESAGSARQPSVKIGVSAESSLQDYRATVAVPLARQLLRQAGVDSEWLLRGASLYLANLVDGGRGRREAEAALDDLLDAVSKGRVYPLAEMPAGDQMAPNELRIANSQTLNVIDYVARLYGHDTIKSLVASATDHELDRTLQQVTGRTLGELEADWSESLARGHAQSEWIEIAQAFDEDAAYAHVKVLSAPDMDGRQPGSRGAQQAAAYIAERFAEYGLVPLRPSSDDRALIDGPLFFQPVPISYTTFLALPALHLVDGQGHVVEELQYRQDFAALVTPFSGAGDVSGDLVWIKGSDWQGIDLDGKIAVQPSSEALQASVTRAQRHHAGALLMVGEKAGRRSSLSKQPLPVTASLSQTMPVLELTRQGKERLLRASGWSVADLGQFPLAQDLGIDARLDVPLSEPVAAESVNVLGLLPGSDPELSKQVILVGAHYDHVGDDPGGLRYAGANDNASGISVILQIARLWQQTGYRPKRSLIFAAWTAQEPGEVGSRFYTEHPVLPLEQTIAVVQLDGVGGGRGYFLEAQGDPEREGLLRFTMEASEAWVDGRLTLTRPTSQSDHVPFREMGIPGLLLTWRESSEENLPDELADPVLPYRLGVTGRMLALTLMSLAG